MSIYSQAKDVIISLTKSALDKAFPGFPEYDFSVEVPKDSSFGDFSTNAAMMGARVLRKAPAVIADAVSEDFGSHRWIESVSVVGGFINFKMSRAFYADVVSSVLSEKENFGRSSFGKGKRYLVEFVSANPTGPMHIGNARGGALGDSLASVLDFAGFKVDREFYVNDAGNQIEKFGLSLDLRYQQLYRSGVEMPEDSYHGEDIIEHAKNFAEKYGDVYLDKPENERRTALVKYALPINVRNLEKDLEGYRIKYDRWYFESDLHKSGAVKKIIDLLKSGGHTYEQDGALWFRATDFGCDKDFVLVRSNSIPTYIVPDIAYHYDKLVTRGYDKAINVLGADHHGYIARMKAALKAIDIDPDKLDIVLMQMVNLIRDGQVVKASKRSGKAITLVTLLDEIPIDAARFFFNLREPDSHFDFDLDLAVSRNNQNPVYYVQYAHARICSILEMLQKEGIDINSPFDAVLCEKPEVELVKKLAVFPEEIIRSAIDYDVSRMTKYSVELASVFHSFYNDCRVKCEDTGKMYARIALVRAVKQTLENVLGLLKVTAPEKM